jgi:hypothetical protein
MARVRSYRAGVTSLRRLARRFPALAAAAVLAALLLRLVVPAGFMPVVEHGRLTIALCSGAGPMTAMPGHGHHQPPATAAKSCAFADLAVPAIGGADPIQLAAALRFVLALGLVLALVLPVVAPARLRPPLRGPPLPS